MLIVTPLLVTGADLGPLKFTVLAPPHPGVIGTPQFAGSAEYTAPATTESNGDGSLTFTTVSPICI